MKKQKKMINYKYKYEIIETDQRMTEMMELASTYSGTASVNI